MHQQDTGFTRVVRAGERADDAGGPEKGSISLIDNFVRMIEGK